LQNNHPMDALRVEL